MDSVPIVRLTHVLQCHGSLIEELVDRQVFFQFTVCRLSRVDICNFGKPLIIHGLLFPHLDYSMCETLRTVYTLIICAYEPFYNVTYLPWSETKECIYNG